jgi:hypothetical protein
MSLLPPPPFVPLLAASEICIYTNDRFTVESLATEEERPSSVEVVAEDNKGVE